jgi:iron complex transport system substrate-binding protein
VSFSRRNFLLCALFFILCALNIPFSFASDIKQTSPQRIVSINVCTDELLLQIVGPERVAALTKFSADPEVSRIASQIKDVKRIQGGIESVQTCGPDLLLGGKFSQKETLRFFGRLGVPVLTFGVPKSFEDIYADIRKLAGAVGETEKGEAIVKEMQDELTALQQNPPPFEKGERGGFEQISPDPSLQKRGIKKRALFLQSGGMVPGLGTFENAIMEASGFENLAATMGIRDYGSLSLEKLIEMKPEVLIFSSDQKEKPTIRGEVLSHPAIRKALPQVKTVTLPSAILNCGSPASVEAVRILVEKVYSPSLSKRG